MGKKGSHIAWVFFFLVTGHAAFCQDTASARAKVDRNAIQIGQPIHFILEANIPVGSSVNWFSLDTIPHFEIVDKGKLDSTDSSGWMVLRQHLIITSFDSGTRFIPQLPLSVGRKQYTTDSIRIEVSYSPFDPKQDYHDIKDIIEVENPYMKYIASGISLLTLISLVLLFLFMRSIKKRAPAAEKQIFSFLSPYAEAVQSLEALKQQQLPENGQVKLYYTRLNDILRLFVLRKLQISSMEKTNEELILQLKSVSLSTAQFSKLAQALRMSDYVKFAKYVPAPDDNENNFGIIESSVHLLNEMHP
jgi:hypothetical protein